MNLNAVKLLIAVIQQGSLLAASHKTGVAVATLSRKINELEQDLGVQLLERSTQGVKPTLVGQQLYEQASLSIETLSELERSIKGNQTQLRGNLRLSVPESFELFWDLLEDFQTVYPDIKVHLLASDRKLDLLADGIDAVIRAGDLETDTLIAKKLLDIRLQLVAAPEFIAAHGTPDTPDQLADFPLLAWAATADHIPSWPLGGQSVRIAPSFACNNYLHLRHFLLHGKGIGDLPDFMAVPLIEQGRLVPVLPDYPFPTTPVHLLYPAHRHPSGIVRAYIDFCLAWLKK
ncbi:LysR family transcriptional regulator [Neisseria perflava]|uniref:LysR family transcriptional regulator n=1 Tax=Neisseria perflava TaxID=33053 RepID=UPI00209F712C|nr:LysR family transcriptional regulator [Neisseria perflava]MCP1661333.1 DNA-binding transcriptional LysR family regulator [Neisseria perflava]MCP1771706.1 DNA-binding transcriptional LysR family regulator [Neisseria perflava]